MNRLLLALVAGTLTAVSSAAWAQSPAPAKDAAKEKGSAAAYQNPAAEQTQAQKSKEAMDAAAKSKTHAKTKTKYDDSAAQAISGSAGSKAATAKANVDASKKMTRQKPKNVKDMTPEERAAWQKQMKEQAKP